MLILVLGFFIVAMIYVLSKIAPASGENVGPMRSKKAPLWEMSWKAFFIGVMLALAANVIYRYPEYKADVAIAQHGDRITAEVVSSRRSCRKGSCFLDVDYRYLPLHSAKAGAYMTGSGILQDPNIDQFSNDVLAGREKHVPIAVAEEYPKYSKMNDNNFAFTRALGIDEAMMIFYTIETSFVAGIFAIGIRNNFFKKSF
jgi:hypothetical protein